MNQNKHSTLWHLFWNNYDKLAIAAREGTPEDCEKLLKEGWKLESRNELGLTPLMISTKNPNIEVFRFLLKAGANINVADDKGQGILLHAISNSRLELVKEIADLIKARFNDFNYRTYKKYIEFYNIRKNLAEENKLLASIWGDDFENHPFPREKVTIPYVFLAATNPDLRVLDYLEENGCDLSLGIKDEINVFTQALENNPNPDIIDYLIKKNLFINNPDLIYKLILGNPSVGVWKRIFEVGVPKKEFLLYLLLSNNDNPNPEIISLLADEKSINFKTDTYNPCLLAVEKSNPVYLKILKEAGADLNESNDYGVTPLMSACSYNPNSEIFDFLIKNGADLSAHDNHGCDVLMYSMINKNLEITKRLIELGADIHSKRPENNENLLMMALRHGANLEKIEYLLSLGIDINEKSSYGFTAIYYAASYNPYVEVLDYLIKKGADINHAPDYAPNTNLLIAAAENKNVEIIKYLIDKGLDINARSRTGNTPLLEAASNPNLEVFYSLLRLGADVKAVDYNNNNALLFASAYNENYQIIPQLLQMGFSLDDKNNLGENALIVATRNKNPEILRVLMLCCGGALNKNKEKDYFNSADIYGNTLLMHAIKNNNIEIIKYLIDKGADVNGKTLENNTVLMLAASNITDPNIIELLINSGADVNAVDNYGFDPINYAAIKNNNPDIIKLLINKGSNVKKTYKDGFTLAHYAATNPNPEIMQLLIDCGVDFDIKLGKELEFLKPLDYDIINDSEDSKYFTPLAIASIYGTPEVCEVLIKAGSRLEVRDRYGNTPLLLATRNRNPEVFKLLLKYGADINALDYMKQGVLNHALTYSNLELVEEIAELTKANFHNYNYQIYVKNKNKAMALRMQVEKDKDLLQRLLSIGIDPDLPKDNKLPYIFLAAKNPDFRVLDFLEEKGCDLRLGTIEENVFTHALSSNPNPNIINYLLSKKLFINDANLIVSCIVKNQSLEFWKRVLDIVFKNNYQFGDGVSLLMALFLEKGNPKPAIVDLLADNTSVNLKTNDGRTACHYAAIKDNLIYLEILKNAGANLHEKDNSGVTPFMDACAFNPNPEIIDYFIENGANLKERDSSGNDALLWAMVNPNLSVIKHLVELGADIHTKNKNLNNILIIALKNRARLEIINYIISLGIDVNEKNEEGLSAIFYAASLNPYPEVLDLLIKKGANLKIEGLSDNDILLWALSNNTNEKVIEYLLNYDFDINLAKPTGETPILSAAQNPNIKIFKLLLERGANIKHEDSMDNDVLHIAAMRNENPQFIEYLLDKGFPMEKRNKLGNTAVFAASRNVNIEVIKMLVAKGGNLKGTNNFGNTILMYLFSSANNKAHPVISIEMVKYLLENGVDVNARNSLNQSALMLAVDNVTDPEYIELLVTAGADVNAEDDNGYTPYKIAKEYNPNPAIAELIKKYSLMGQPDNSKFNIPKNIN